MNPTRRSFTLGALGGALAASLATPVLARAPKAAAQAPGFFRFAVGDAEVTALADGSLPIPTSAFTGGSPDAAALIGTETVATSVNGWLINTGERLVLVDAGTSDAMGDILGKLATNLAAAGYAPAQVDDVVLTHLHVDHAFGLLTAGAMAFPNAQVHVAEAEIAFWSDDTILAGAPDFAKPHFKYARDAVKPYVEAGRLVRFKSGEVLPGLTAEAAPGHTPGHTMLRLASGRDQLLIWGDIVHNVALQVSEPDRALMFDTDQTQAIATRKTVLDMAATDRLLVAGAHIPFPGIGRVVKGPGAYRFIGQPWSATL